MISLFKKILSGIFGDLNYQKYATNYIARNSTLLFFIQCFSILLVFVSNYVLIKTAGVDNYGAYVFVFNLVYLLLNFSLMGFDTLLIKKAAIYEDISEYGEFKGLLLTSVIIILISSAVAASIFQIAGKWSNPEIISNEMNWFLIAFFSLLMLSAAALFQSVLQGRRKIVWSQIGEKIVRPLLLIIIVVGYYYLYKSVSLKSLIWINITAIGLAMSVTLWFFKKTITGKIGRIKAVFHVRDWMKASFSFLLVDLLYNGNSRISIFLLGIFRTGDDVGIFNIALRISEVISFALVIVNFVLSPVIAKLYAAGKMNELQILVKRCARITLVVGTVLTAGILLFSNEILSLFGSTFLEGRPALMTLCYGQVINILCGSVGLLLIMTGKQRYSIYSLALGLITNVLFNLLLTPRYGVSGAAISLTASLIIWNLAMYYFVRRTLNIRPTAFGV
ncbi:flippase [soil metagenome]